MLVYFMKGRLPWQGLRVKDEERDQRILDIKTATSADELCCGLPWEFAACLRHAKSLQAGRLPKYDEIRKMFKSLAAKEDIPYDNVFDWTERLLPADQLD